VDGEIIELEVLNWQKMQHSNGNRTYDWFKFSSKMMLDVEIKSLTPQEFKVWIFLLCLCAEFRSSHLKVTVKSLASHCEVYSKWVRSAITRLEQFQIVRKISGTTEQNRIEENRYLKGEKSQAPASLPAPIEDKKLPSVTPSVPQKLIGIYVSCFQKKYGKGARPDLGGKSQGCLKRLVKDYGENKMAVILSAYLEMDDDWFKKRCHDLVTLEQCVHKVVLAISTRNKNPSMKQKGIEEILEERERMKNGEMGI